MSEDKLKESSYSRYVSQPLAHNPYYSYVVKAGKILLPLTALGIAAFLFVWPLMNENPVFRRNPPEQAGRMSTAQLTSTPAAQDQQIEMASPEFSGLDREGRPFTITADRVLQKDSTMTSDMTLIMPVADIFLKDQTWLALKANEGLYLQEKQNLDLQGAVTLFHDDGYSLRSESMFVELNTGLAHTENPVHIQGPAGMIDAQNGMTMKDFGQTIVFKGPAKLTLYGDTE